MGGGREGEREEDDDNAWNFAPAEENSPSSSTMQFRGTLLLHNGDERRKRNPEGR